MRGPFALMVALASVLAAGPAAAERLIASLTNHRVMITSSYTGVELVLFGSVERDPASVERKGPYDVVATITGPREPLRTNVDHTPWRSLSGTFRFAAGLRTGNFQLLPLASPPVQLRNAPAASAESAWGIRDAAL
jgi:Putative transmembrane protein (Alph_Pro_TM)